MFARSASRAIVASLAFLSAAQAAPYPTRTIEIIVPYGAGGSTDFVARTIAQRLGERLGQSVVVLNRPGGSGTIGVGTALRANPDGHTLLLSYTSELVVVPQVNRSVKYSVEDFTPIAVTGIVPVVLIVSNKLGVDTMQDLVEEIRRSPGKYTFSGGLGSPSHILGSWLNQLKQLEARHVPSRDGAQSVGDVVGGHIDMFYGGTSVVKPAIESGSVKAIAIAGVRSSSLPNVPTFKEAGLADFELASWNVMLAPKGTPADIVQLLRKEVLAILADPQVRKNLADSGSRRATRRTSPPFSRASATSLARWCALSASRSGSRNLLRRDCSGARLLREPEQAVPRQHDRESDRIGPPGADRLRERVNREETETEADERSGRVREHARRRRPADARMQNHHEARHRHRKHGEHAGGERTDAVARRRYRNDEERDRERAQEDVEAAALHAAFRRRRHPISAGNHQGGGKHESIKQDRRPWRPVHRMQCSRACQPNEQGRAEAQEQPAPLRQRGIDEREDDNCYAGRQAADRARRDEGGRMFEGEDDVGGARGGRQGGDDRADEWTAAFDHDRRGHHDGGRQGHLEPELEQEKQRG